VLKTLTDPAGTFLPGAETALQNQLQQDEINRLNAPKVFGPISWYDISDLFFLVAGVSGGVPNWGKLSGAEIKGFTRHGLNSAISHDGVGVSEKAMIDAVKNPLNISPQSNGTFLIEGRDATVILNSDGEVVTTWANTKNGWRIK
jgi:hypothetical protein